jgi:hypothetical protein
MNTKHLLIVVFLVIIIGVSAFAVFGQPKEPETPAHTPSPTASNLPTPTVKPSSSLAVTPSPTNSPTNSPTSNPTATPSVTTSPTPTQTATPTLEPTTPTQTNTPNPTPTTIGTKNNPAPINTPVTLTYETLNENYTYTVKLEVTEVIRGTQAEIMIEEANSINPPPASDTEYMLIKIRYTYLSGPTNDTSIMLTDGTFQIYSSTGIQISQHSLVAPEPSISKTFYSGATVEGYGAYQVPKGEDKLLMAYRLDWQGRGGAWFQLYS